MHELEISGQQMTLVAALVSTLPSLRKRYGVSQTMLGEKVGLSRQTISSIERGTTPLTWNNFLAIMMFFMANNSCVFYFPKRNGYKYADELMEVLVLNKRGRGQVRSIDD